MAKFASITADLLVRKNEAAPSLTPQSKPLFSWNPELDLPSHKVKPSADPDRPRRLFVPLSHEEHERLFIAAAKKNATPHQIVHAALEAYFQKLAADAQCRCIADVRTRGCADH